MILCAGAPDSVDQFILALDLGGIDQDLTSLTPVPAPAPAFPFWPADYSFELLEPTKLCPVAGGNGYGYICDSITGKINQFSCL